MPSPLSSVLVVQRACLPEFHFGGKKMPLTFALAKGRWGVGRIVEQRKGIILTIVLLVHVICSVLTRLCMYRMYFKKLKLC